MPNDTQESVLTDYLPGVGAALEAMDERELQLLARDLMEHVARRTHVGPPAVGAWNGEQPVVAHRPGEMMPGRLVLLYRALGEAVLMALGNRLYGAGLTFAETRRGGHEVVVTQDPAEPKPYWPLCWCEEAAGFTRHATPEAAAEEARRHLAEVGCDESLIQFD